MFSHTEMTFKISIQDGTNLKTMVRRRIDQMISTRNFKAWNERTETGVLVKSHKKEKGQR